jgi:UDP-2-acetamido-3-amino-2,3-dideoxy-glucuronate N-acetyltransferase
MAHDARNNAPARIHSTAIVEDGAVIGAGTAVWHHSHVRTGARIGADSSLGKNVFVDHDVRVGSGVKIQNNVSVYAGVTVEDDVFLGPSMVFTNDLLPRAGATDWQVVETVVRRGASIGANATIVAGNTIGRHALVGAGTVVTRPVDDHQVVVGNPARHHGWACACGHIVSRDAERPATVVCEVCGADR